jgi:polysaccharide pyruvyl transferase WcaK-like protein
MLVSGRVHGLSQHVPTVIIDYEPKAHKIMGFAKVEEYVAIK